MISFFIPIGEALIAGYLAAVAIYMVLLFFITRLGRGALMNGLRASYMYSALHTLSWTAAALAGAYLCCGMAPLPPYGLVGFPLLLALALAYLAFRNFRQLPGQMSVGALASIFVGIVTGTVVALVLRHAFLAVKNA